MEQTVVLREYTDADGAVQKSEATFRIRNRGTEPLIIETIASSCGCAIVAQPNGPIPPGQERDLKVLLTGLPVGERSVAVRVKSNATNTPDAVLRLNVQGDTTPPYVTGVTGIVNFGTADTTEVARDFGIILLERAGDEPVNPVPTSDLACIEISPNGVEDRKVGDNLVERRYMFQARLKEQTVGPFHGEVTFRGGTRVIHGASRARTHLRGRVAELIELTPSAVYLTREPTAHRLHATLSVTTPAEDPTILIKVPSEVEKFVSFERVGTTRDRSGKFSTSFALNGILDLAPNLIRGNLEIDVVESGEPVFQVPFLLVCSEGQ